MTECAIVPAPRSFKRTGGNFVSACIELNPEPRFMNAIGAFREDLVCFFGEECLSPGSYREQRSFAQGIEGAMSLWGGNFQPESAPILKLFFMHSPTRAPGSYALALSRESALIEASDDSGARAGMSSLAQLMLAGWDGWRFGLPACSIEDRPEYSWRGVLLDCARHFIPLPEIKKIIRTLSLYKINRLHWHLTDDQGWRIQLLSHPELAERGSLRPGDDPNRDGYYSREDILDVVDFAARRGIGIMPEVDLPGHARAVLACRPELSCTGGPHTVMTAWGISDEVLCMGNPAALRVVKEVWTELCSLFPAPWVHVGGDECPTTRWALCPRCQQKKRESGLSRDVDLHGWFIAELSAHLRSLGKEVFGWDEVLDSSIENGAGVFHWRNSQPELAEDALRRGRDLVISPNYPYYLDFIQKKDRFSNPGVARTRKQVADLETIYRFDPEGGIDTSMDLPGGEKRGRLLGIQANVWTEYIRDEKRLEYMLFPRILAVAETGWLGKNRPGWRSFSRRMECQLDMLTRIGINACRLP
jgi:hexosaminidase